MASDARNPVKSVQTAMEIIRILTENESVGVTELSQKLSLSKGPTHSHLATLRSEDYVVKEGDEYRLGLRFVDIAHHVKDQYEIYDIVTTEVDTLAEKSGEMALFTVEEQGKGVCLYRQSGENAVKTQLYVGYRNDLYHTAVGKAILAHKEYEEILSGIDLEPVTKHTITDEGRLIEELEEIRETGIAYSYQESIPGLAGVGAPIRSQDGGIYGAIAVIGPTSRMDDERIEEVTTMINHAVNVIEINATAL